MLIAIGVGILTDVLVVVLTGSFRRLIASIRSRSAPLHCGAAPDLVAQLFDAENNLSLFLTENVQ
jgi:hypothetical protein